MKNIITKIKYLVLLVFAAFSLNSCEDSAPTDYIAKNYVEAYLYVDMPIKNLLIMNTQPISELSDKSKYFIKDANVVLIENNDTLRLTYDFTNNSGYYNSNTEYLVKPNTLYKLIVTLKDGKTITGQTKTPGRVKWIDAPKPTFYYPSDTLKLPGADSLNISWAPVQGNNFYLIRVTCLDTLNYGKYLTPSSNELNARCYNIMSNMIDDKENPYYKEKTGWGLIANTSSATVWLTFKWFGKQEVTVLAPDQNMINWFINLKFSNSSQTGENLNSVTNAFGVFGSASTDSKEVFMYKNIKK